MTREVSIHAPWEGCDSLGGIAKVKEPTFQFTHPGKGATLTNYLSPLAFNKFQFTHPGKGATDLFCVGQLSGMSFNSRTLGRVRLLLISPDSLLLEFQFTHPGKGATLRSVGTLHSSIVSIHAPWEGCDATQGIDTILSLVFQFTHPGKGATPRHRLDDAHRAVSIHAPWEGCDSPTDGRRGSRSRFNSRTLGRVRPRSRT